MRDSIPHMIMDRGTPTRRHQFITATAGHPTRSAARRWVAAALLATAMLGALLQTDAAEAKRKAPYRPEPDLRIVAVTASPVPYFRGRGTLDLAIEVVLPKDLAGARLLEVTSLISSPSKRSMRFLSSRQPIEVPPAADPPLRTQAPETSPTAGPARTVVILSWDGTDQTKQFVEHGRYHYEVRAKLLAVGESGPRTQTVSWPKRGTLEVK